MDITPTDLVQIHYFSKDNTETAVSDDNVYIVLSIEKGVASLSGKILDGYTAHLMDVCSFEKIKIRLFKCDTPFGTTSPVLVKMEAPQG